MCLGVPAQIVSRSEGFRAEVEIGGIRRDVDVALVPEARIGDYVLIHAGYAIELIDEVDAQETLSLIQQMAELADRDLS